MLKKFWSWLFPQQRDYTEETIQRLTKACAECGAALHESLRKVDARRERIATELLKAGRGNPTECVEAAEMLCRALDDVPSRESGDSNA